MLTSSLDEDSRKGLEKLYSLFRNPTFRSLVESFLKGKYNEMKQRLNVGFFSNSVCDN